MSWLRTIPHYFRASTLRLLLRDLYYRVPLPGRLKWTLRNLRLRAFRGGRSRSAVGVHGPWRAALALSRRVEPVSEEVRRVLHDPGCLAEHAFSEAQSPDVSVVIPVHNKIEFTVACLLSIVFNRPAVPFEIVIVDDASSDASASLLSRWPGLRYTCNPRNLGFIDSCNRGAELARGRFVCFLNNDTNVLRGWLDELHWTLLNVPGAALAGSKLVYPRGELQESGGIVWRDGSAWNYGHGGDPDDPRTSYLRDVDYVSGASLMVSAALFKQLGGFDTLYRPAYYEDSDLAFRIRRRGLRTLVQPASMVVHYEGVSSGRDPATGVKRFQAVNQTKFQERWKDVLAQHRRNGESPELEKERSVGRRLLMVDATTPQPDRDAGSVTAEHFIRIFQRLGYKVSFLPEGLRYDPEYAARLQRSGVECIYYPFGRDVRQFLRHRGEEFDIVFISRPHVADSIVDHVKKTCTKAKIIYNTVDLHYLREMRQAEHERNPALMQRAAQTKRTELRVIAAADCSIVISAVEKSIVGRELPQARLEVVPLIQEEQQQGLPFGERLGLIFIGGSRHPPNADAVVYFAREIMPTLRMQGICETFYVIGERSAGEIRGLRGADVQVLGQVEDIAEYFKRARCMVVPLRYGAGVKGKIGTAFAYGLPVVSTAVGVEGMDLVEERDYLRAERAVEWAEQIRRLSVDEALWTGLSGAGRRIVRERYSPERVADQLQRLIESLQAP